MNNETNLNLENQVENPETVENLLEKENQDSWKYGGRTKKGFVDSPEGRQLGLFD